MNVQPATMMPRNRPRQELFSWLIFLLLIQACSRGGDDPAIERGVLVSAIDFRNQAAHNYVTALSSYADPGAIARFSTFDDAVWPVTKPRVGWAFMLGTSIMIMGSRADDVMTVAYYHPWSDVVMVTAWWCPGTTPPRLFDVEILMGDFFRKAGQPRFETSRPWMRQDQYRPLAVGLSTAHTVRTIEYFLRHARPGPGGWRTLIPGLADHAVLAGNHHGAGFMLMSNIGELGDVYSPDDEAGRALQRAITRLSRSILRGDPSELANAPGNSAGAREAFATLSPDSLAPFQLTAAIGGAERALLMLSRADNPDVYLSLLFQRQGAEYTLLRSDMMSFQAFYDLTEGGS